MRESYAKDARKNSQNVQLEILFFLMLFIK